MYDFNVALLGKQAWRLLTNQDALVSKLYQARYYPHCSFLDAKIGNNPSYVWRSILQAQMLIKSGDVRRIGDGSNTDILSDPWLPTHEDHFVRSAHQALRGNTVSSLMITGQSEWDMEVLGDIFDEREANIIAVIPINNSRPDSWYWSKEKMGMYTVKSAYASIQDRANVNDLSDNSGLWRKIWNLKIPGQVKVCVWRALNEALPTKDQLLRRRVEVNCLCPVCNGAQEDTLHAIIFFLFATACWNMLGFTKYIRQPTSLQQWLQAVMQHCSKEEVQKVVMVIWAVWRNRNNVIWDQKGMEPSEVLVSANLFFNQ